MNNDIVQQWRSHVQSFQQQQKDSIMVFGLGWVVVSEKQCKQESLNDYRIIVAIYNVANQKPVQEHPHNTHNLDFLEKQCNAAMKKYSAQSNL
jgi:hypothetical protein